MLKAVLVIMLFCSCFAEDHWVTVLCYHKFMPKSVQNYDTSVEDFEKQMVYIKKNFKVMSLSELVKRTVRKEPLDGNTVLVTMDDGDKSIYTYAHPVMKKLALPYSVFMYTNVTEEGGRGLTWEEVKKLAYEGAEIGSHSISHCVLTKKNKKEKQEEYEARVRKEINESKKIIEEKIGIPVLYFAYPYGRYNDFIECEAIAAGYEAIMTTDWGSNKYPVERYKIKRRMMLKGMTFKAFTEGFNEKPR